MRSPLTPPECDLRDSKFMPVFINRILNSQFNAQIDDTAWRIGVTLWMRAWHQVSAASLPDDDIVLTGLAGLGRDVETWRKAKAQALHGWIKCDDGRFYHEVIAEAALEAWVAKLFGRINSGSGNAKRWSIEFDSSHLDAQLAEAFPYLKALSPRSDMLSKITRRFNKQNAENDPQRTPQDNPQGTPDGNPLGSPPSNPPSSPDGNADGNPQAIPKGFPKRSQEKGKGEGKEEYIKGVYVSNETHTPLIAGASARENDFSIFCDRYPKPDKLLMAQTAWEAALSVAKPEEILAGLDRWLAEWRRRYGEEIRYIPSACEWLTSKSWMKTPKPMTEADRPPSARNWDGPPEIRAAVVAADGEATAQNYLDPARWDPDRRRIITRTGIAAERLRKIAALSPYTIERHTEAEAA